MNKKLGKASKAKKKKAIGSSDINRRFLFANVFAVLCAIILFIFLLLIENRVIGKRYTGQDFVLETTLQEVEQLQKYIFENDLTTKDMDEIDQWVFNRRNVFLIIYDGGRVIYDSTYGSEEPRETSGENENDIILPTRYHPKYSLEFSDKTVSCDFVTFLNMRARFIYGTFQFAICCLLVLAIVIFNFYKITSYYKTLEEDARKIEGGDLNHKITIKGHSRLSALADAMERMRVSIIERHEKEKELIESSHNLVRSMSHDLRTPLTILIGYLEILSGKKYKDEETRDIYIDKCKDKAYQIKYLSDRLFEYFLAFSTEEDTLHPLIYEKNVFSQLIEDYVFTLNEKEFDLNYSPDQGNNYFISMDIQLMRRVMDNVFSNITKYGDKEKPVDISVSNNGEELVFSFSNYRRKNLAEVESTNIGLSVSEKIISMHKGSLEIKKGSETFKVTVKLPIAETRSELENKELKEKGR
ncbi:MAG: HAMP domain-containing histidine kinase [Clostridiales bacterium]|nr:HAMP domain-containing histidine kinase [Clostridiales bacterium]